VTYDHTMVWCEAEVLWEVKEVGFLVPISSAVLLLLITISSTVSLGESNRSKTAWLPWLEDCLGEVASAPSHEEMATATRRIRNGICEGQSALAFPSASAGLVLLAKEALDANNVNGALRLARLNVFLTYIHPVYLDMILPDLLAHQEALVRISGMDIVKRKRLLAFRKQMAMLLTDKNQLVREMANRTLVDLCDGFSLDFNPKATPNRLQETREKWLNWLSSPRARQYLYWPKKTREETLDLLFGTIVTSLPCPRNQPLAHESASVTEHGLYIGIWEVSVAEFALFVTVTNFKTESEKSGYGHVMDGKALSHAKRVAGVSWRNPSGHSRTLYKRLLRPVTQISGKDAQAYCQWLGKQLGLSVRLPYEREWRLAAFTKTNEKTQRYPGSKGPKTVMSRKPGTDKEPNIGGTSGYDRSPCGCHDMQGNVGEWCLDASGNPSMVLGNSFADDNLFDSRSRATRKPSGYCDNTIGFRIVISTR